MAEAPMTMAAALLPGSGHHLWVLLVTRYSRTNDSYSIWHGASKCRDRTTICPFNRPALNYHSTPDLHARPHLPCQTITDLCRIILSQSTPSHHLFQGPPADYVLWYGPKAGNGDSASERTTMYLSPLKIGDIKAGFSASAYSTGPIF